MTPDHALAQDKLRFPTIRPPCPYVGTCGGCSLQDLAYADQLTLKRERLARLLQPFGVAEPIELVAAQDPWRYRNKAEMTFGIVDGEIVLGYHVARSFRRVVDVDECLLLPEPMMAVATAIERAARASGLPVYHPTTHQGVLRSVVLRRSRATGQMLACLVTATTERAAIERIFDEVRPHHPDVVGWSWGVTQRLADVAVPDELHVLAGQAHLEERIGPFALELHPFNFLQPNPAQAERLYQQMAEWVRASGAVGTAWDVYCGVGLVSFYLASHAQRLFGIDVDAANLELARQNALRNRLSNVQFHLGKAEDVFADKRFWLLEAKPDLIVVDPPRIGLHERVIGMLSAARPHHIVYVSCNALSLARDLHLLARGFPAYEIERLTAFDLFPHTNHVEVLTLLRRAAS